MRANLFTNRELAAGQGPLDGRGWIMLRVAGTTRRSLAVAGGLLGLCCAIILRSLPLGHGAAADDQEYRGTPEQQAACMNDVFRLCWNDVPNVSRIVACLKRERSQLSAGCKAVFNENSATRYASLHHR